MHRSNRQSPLSRPTTRAPMRRPGGVGTGNDATPATAASAAVAEQPRAQLAGVQQHPLANVEENARLYDYERRVKDAFDGIVPVLKSLSALQHEDDFVDRAQAIARENLGFLLPDVLLEDAWIDQLDMKRLFAWSIFQTYKRYSDDYFLNDPLDNNQSDGFEEFLQGCGFHTLDITPCSDGRLAHFIRYILRLPHHSVRRKSYAGAMFDVDDNIQKWVETEMFRFREGRPNLPDAPTRYLKVVAYHFSSVDPTHEGCAAHGSDTRKAAQSGLDRLTEFKHAIENSFCCGASIDLLLIGVDTDTDSIRVHLPNQQGDISLDHSVNAIELFEKTRELSAEDAREAIANAVERSVPTATKGMRQLSVTLIENNFSQIAYVRNAHGYHYPDTGHTERFIGAGIGFEEKQLRNLMYFAYLNTVEEAVADLDVGISIFTRLNVSHGLPVPVVVRFDYHSQVPGARERAVQRCARVTNALMTRYAELAEKGLLHVMQLVRDCTTNGAVEVLDCSADVPLASGAH